MPRDTDVGTRPASYASISRGVYFLANDGVIDIAIAFLNSFRNFNPFVPLCLIPYADDTARLRQLAADYRFTIHDDADSLRRCDAISVAIHGRQRGQYRKLCAFEGPFDEFIYIDCDTIVLRDMYFVFQFLTDYDFITTHSDLPSLKQWVWHDSIDATGALTAAQIAFSANMGVFCSRRGALTIDWAEDRLPGALQLLPHMVLLCADQPFLNYLVVTSTRPYTSLLRLSRELGAPDMPRELWAGHARPGGSRFQRRWLGPNLLLVHWAGLWSASWRDQRLYRWLRRFGFQPEAPTVRLRLPNGALWRHYRRLRQGGSAPAR